MSDDIHLPELPEPDEQSMANYGIENDCFSWDAMEDYARAAVLADRARRAQPAPGAWQPIETAPKPDIGADGFGVRLLLAVDCGEGTIASVKKGYWEGTDWYLDCCIGLAWLPPADTA